MNGLRWSALRAIILVVTVTSLSAFAESFAALYLWGSRHGLHGTWAVIFPLQIDTFILIGELALVVGLADQWKRRDRASAWTVTALGLAASVAANVGHVATHDWASRLTAAVPPVAAAASLSVGLGVLKRVTALRARKQAEVPPEVALAAAEAQKAAAEAEKAAAEAEKARAEAERAAAGPGPEVLAQMAKGDAIRLALARTDGNVRDAVDWLASQGVTVNRNYANDVAQGTTGKRRPRRSLPPDPRSQTLRPVR